MKTCLKKSFTLVLLLFVFAPSLYAQRDTIFFVDHTKAACFLKEIDPDVIVYTLPGEELINTVYKNTVQKIKLRNGRVQLFTDVKIYKPLAGLQDYESVAVINAEGDVQGLYKLGTIGTIARKGADKRLKMQAAMMGANVVYINNQNANGTSGTDDVTYAMGSAYTSVPPDPDKFKKLIGARTDYAATQTYSLGGNDNNISSEASYRHFTINSVNNDNGIVSIKGKLKDEDDVNVFQLAGFSNDAFTISYTKANTTYNVVISTEEVIFVN